MIFYSQMCVYNVIYHIDLTLTLVTLALGVGVGVVEIKLPPSYVCMYVHTHTMYVPLNLLWKSLL